MGELDEQRAMDAVDEGNKLALLGRHREAISYFERARDLGATWVGLNIGNSHAALGDEAGAELEYRRAWNESNDPDAAFNLAVLLDRRRSEEAHEVYRRLIELGYAKAAVNEACSLREAGDYERAAMLLETALGDGEIGDIAAGILGSILRERGRSAEAEPYLRRAANIDPTARAELGHVLMALGREQDAVSVWHSGSEANEAESLLPLANYYAERQDIARAEALYRRGYEQGDPNSATNLAILLWESGHQKEAKQWVRRGARMGDSKALTWQSEIGGSDD